MGMTTGDHTATPDEQRWHLGLVVVALAAATLIALGPEGWPQAVGVIALGAAATVVILQRAGASGITCEGSWCLVGLGVVLSTICEVLHIIAVGLDTPSTVLCAIGYGCIIAGLATEAWRRPEARVADTLLDSVIIAIGAGLLLWTAAEFASPVPISSWNPVHLALPILGLIASGLAIHVALAENKDFWILGVGLLVMTTGNAIHAAEAAGIGLEVPVDRVVAGCWAAGLLLVVIAALRIRRPAPKPPQGLGSGMTVTLLGVALLIGPAALLSNLVSSRSAVLDATLGILLATLLLVRLARGAMRLDAALAQSQRAEQIRDLALRSASMAAWEWQAATNDFVRSPGMATLHGFDESEASQLTSEMYLSTAAPEDRQRLIAWDERIMAEAGPHQLEYAIITPAGERRLLRETATSIANDSGRIVLVRGISQDITADRDREVAILHAQQLLRDVVENLPVSVFIRPVDATKVPRYGNAAIERTFGMPWEEWAPSWESRIHPDDQAEVYAAADRLWETGETFRQQYRERTASGDYIWVSDTGVLVRDAEGKPSFWITTKFDVTEQVELLQSLEAAEGRLRDLVDGLPITTYLTPPDDLANPTWFSPQVVDLTGYTAAEATGEMAFFPLVSHPEDNAGLAAEAARCVETLQPFRAVYRLNRKDGREIWVRDEAMVLRDEAGVPVSWQGYMVDVTQQVESEEALRIALDQAREAGRLKDVFLSTISHELRTPLTGIIGYAHLLLDGYSGPLTADQERDVSQISASGEHLLGLIAEILDISRMESGTITLHPEVVSVREAVAHAIAVTQPLAVSAGLTLGWDAAEGLPPVVADPGRVQQVLVNLIGNAIKFTKEGSVGVDAQVDGTRVAIRVADTGIGIAPEHLELVFEPFRQVDDALTRQRGGTGLGLAISRRLARMMGGDVTVESTLGRGSTFTLWLPTNGARIGGPDRAD